MQNNIISIGIIGLGYVGLPLALSFSEKYPTIGFDIHTQRIEELQKGYDRCGYINEENWLLRQQQQQTPPLTLSYKIEDISVCNHYIVTVPTPTDSHNKPDLQYVIQACEMLAPFIKKGDYIIFESTVYPGVTEEVCIPILQCISGLKYNTDFFVGYSPERINPGDSNHRLENIIKITSGSSPEAAVHINQLYQSIIHAGTYLAPSIKVAEAAKVVENSQRDINIAFMNELAQIFSRLNIDTQEVLKAAQTKWNFLPFKPGLVGGHCISVDPYYLVQKANDSGYQPELILAARKLNNSMGKWVASEIIKLMIQKGAQVNGGRILCMGITFKENCSSITNSKAFDVIHELKQYKANVDIYDPHAHPDEVLAQLSMPIKLQSQLSTYDGIVLLVAHEEFLNWNFNHLKRNSHSVIYDVQGILPQNSIDGRL